MPAVLGAPHYSYRFAEAKFLALFDRRDMAPGKLVMPEYYNGPQAFAPGVFDVALPTLHLIFRSTEQIRLLKFALNICCFAWEFDVLKDATLVNEHPFLNQKRMLELCDEVWVPSHYTGNVLRAHGLAHSVCIPAPVPMPAPAATVARAGADPARLAGRRSDVTSFLALARREPQAGAGGIKHVARLDCALDAQAGGTDDLPERVEPGGFS